MPSNFNDGNLNKSIILCLHKIVAFCLLKMNSSAYLINSYARLNVRFSYGKRVHLFDTSGKSYFDAITGIGVNALGHNHPKITKVISKQAKKLIHCSNLYQIKPQEQLGKKLCELAQMKSAFFCNSGTEATECAIKITRLFARNKKFNNPKVIVFKGGFHGRSFAGLSATLNPKIQQGFEPLLTGFLEAKLNDVESVKKLFETEKEIAAVFIEPIQGESGIHIADTPFLQFLQKICNHNDALLIFDEVQSGLARTGKWFAGHNNNGVMADVVTLAKPLGAGLPIGACLVNEKADLIMAGKHGSTFGGNPLCTKTALEFLKIIEKENLIKNINKQSQKLIAGIRKIFNEPVYQIRAKGLMIGIEANFSNPENVFLKNAFANLAKNSLEIGLLINVTNTSTIRLLPAYIMNNNETQELLDKLNQLKENFLTSKT